MQVSIWFAGEYPEMHFSRDGPLADLRGDNPCNTNTWEEAVPLRWGSKKANMKTLPQIEGEIMN
jgi:hypothetical protein